MAALDTSVAATDGQSVPVLAARGISKRFGAFTALDAVDFDVRPGEIHALLGENGAGKSTLMNVLSGLLRPTVGTIALNNAPVRFHSPADAETAGVSMVHQHFLLVPTLSVRENLLLSAPRGFGGPFSYPMQAALADVMALAKKLNWQIPYDAPAGRLPIGTQQRVEILKALRGETKVLIFDEPTAVLTPTETPELFATIRRLADEGRGIVFISHKLNEVRELAGRVTVLRRGKVVFRTNTKDTDAAGLAQAMVGQDSEAATMLAGEASETRRSAPRPAAQNTPRLQVAHLAVSGGQKAKPALSNLDFSVAAGEIFGIAGVDGNGQEELAACLSGLLRPDSGTITVENTPLLFNPAVFRHAGVAVIPADRQTRGLALPMNITENVALGVYDKSEFRRGPMLLWPALTRRAADLIARFDIRATGPRAETRSLSGGNQQKVVIARALADHPKVVIAVNPTRGLDVGAIAYVHNALKLERDNGAAIVLISTELDEVLALSDRVAVLYEGQFTGIVPPTTARETLGLLMGGKTGDTVQEGAGDYVQPLSPLTNEQFISKTTTKRGETAPIVSPTIKDFSSWKTLDQFETVRAAEEWLKLQKQGMVAVDFGNRLDIANIVCTALKVVSQKGIDYPASVVVNRSWFNEIDKPHRQGAIASVENAFLHLNPDADYWQNPVVQSSDLYGFWSTNHPLHPLFHEAGHWGLFQLKGRAVVDKYQGKAHDAETQSVARSVSDYAVTNVGEFLSEALAVKLSGGQLPDEAEKLYKRYGGLKVVRSTQNDSN